MSDYTPPLTGWVLSNYDSLCRRLARQAVRDGVEYAVTMSAPTDGDFALQGPVSGRDRSVTSPSPPDGHERSVYLHTHPESTQVTFSTQDIRAFAQGPLRTVPFGRLVQPHGYGVIGRRMDDTEQLDAQLQTLEPTLEWANAGVLKRKEIQQEVRSVAQDSSTVSEHNPVLDVLDPYIVRSSVEFDTRPNR